MDLKVAVKVVKEFMGSYCGEHGEAMRTIVAEVERRKTVRAKRPVQHRKGKTVRSCMWCRKCCGWALGRKPCKQYHFNKHYQRTASPVA